MSDADLPGAELVEAGLAERRMRRCWCRSRPHAFAR